MYISLNESAQKFFSKAMSNRSASAKLGPPVIVHGCNTAWSAINPNVTIDTEGINPREGSAYNVIGIPANAAGSGGGMAGASISVPGSLSISYLLAEVRTNRLCEAGELLLGVGTNQSDAINKARPIGAITNFGGWHTVAVPADNMATASTLAYVALCIRPGSSAVTVKIDYVRYVTDMFTGTYKMKFAGSHTLTDEQTRHYVVEFPFESGLVSTSPAPFNVELVPYDADGVEQGHIWLDAGDALGDMPRRWAKLAILRPREFATGESFVLEVVG